MNQLRDTFQRPLRDLRISVTDRCNFRCTYCMPAHIFHERFQFLPHEQVLSFEELNRLTRLITGLGAVKLRLTGGEPLVRQDIDILVGMLTKIEGVDDVAMTTNAYLLPKFASKLKSAGLQRLTISLDSINEATFQKMNGERSTVAKVLEGIDAAKAAGFERIKINCVVQRGVNDNDIVSMANWAREEGHILRFIEYMDVGTMNGWRLDDVVPAKEIAEKVNAAFPLERVKRSYSSETALRYQYKDGLGEIGIIASVTMPFCGDCSRMRLSPEGQIFTCLFAKEGVDLKTPLREGATDEELVALISQTWNKRDDRYSESRTEATSKGDKVEMYFIGG
jgi:cyclic pyranopterin phosphate synthase